MGISTRRYIYRALLTLVSGFVFFCRTVIAKAIDSQLTKIQNSFAIGNRLATTLANLLKMNTNFSFSSSADGIIYKRERLGSHVHGVVFFFQF